MRSSPLDKSLASTELQLTAPRNTLNAFGGRWEMACGSNASYRVRICEGLTAPRSNALREAVADRRALLVMTPTVAQLHASSLAAKLPRGVATMVLGVGETSKTMQTVEQVCAEAVRHGLTRDGLLVAVGGGVCSDVVTMAASIIRRGVGHVRIPTTLIGQIDAGVGLKGSINFLGKKSFLGCFHPPEQVLIDPAFLRTLPKRFLVSGIAESVKMAVSRDWRLFALLESRAEEMIAAGFASEPEAVRELLERSITGMLDELSQNPYEDQTWERVVDFGHTFSPALEAALNFDIHHGEAVAVDIALSATLSRSMGLLSGEAHQRIIALLKRCGLPIWMPELTPSLCTLALADASRHRGGCANLVIPTRIGGTAFVKRTEDIPPRALEHALRHLAGLANEGVEACAS
ncbi:MAG: sedoheptulose 7-phosphate cyclase [Myxococcaceae bacterium]